MIKNNRYYWSHLKTANVTVRVVPKQKQEGVVFRVGNMIDLGNGRQTVMLDHVDFPNAYYAKTAKNANVAVPFCMGVLDFVYTSPRKPVLRDVHSLLSTLYKGDQVEKIVLDVLSPGDLLVFKHDADTQRIKLVDTLRVVKENTYMKSKAEYAL
tara:strand:- start:105 stop:566 length:462 start_codon:yes stop_codon:yes gene_type:complete